MINKSKVTTWNQDLTTNRTDRAAACLAWFAALAVPTIVLGLVVFLLWRGGAGLSGKLIFGEAHWLRAVLGREQVFDGLWPAMAGTVMLVLGASAIAIPLGVAAGIYLAEYASDKAQRPLKLVVDLLAGVPSIIMGLLGFGVILFLRKSIMASTVCLAGANGCSSMSRYP